MTHVILTPDAARTALDATIRHQLREAWERGMETTPHGVNALADRGAPVAFEAIMRDIDDYVTAITSQWREKEYPPAIATGTEPGGRGHTTGKALTYRLTCGCTDWCNCTQCLAGTAHEEGESWACDTHGRTTVAWRSAHSAPEIVAADGALTVCHSAHPFTFAPGHRMRAAKCLICHLLIGSGEAALVGVGVLAGDACRCGGVVSDLYLIHATHMPMDPDDLAAAVHRGLACRTCNPAD